LDLIRPHENGVGEKIRSLGKEILRSDGCSKSKEFNV
jgi:hypothetical protein